MCGAASKAKSGAELWAVQAYGRGCRHRDPPTQPASCSCLCRARILFLLQLLADHVPGVGLVASKCRIGM